MLLQSFDASRVLAFAPRDCPTVGFQGPNSSQLPTPQFPNSQTDSQFPTSKSQDFPESRRYSVENWELEVGSSFGELGVGIWELHTDSHERLRRHVWL